jgi:hypothetical protein
MKIKLYGKLLEELKLLDKTSVYDTLPTLLNDQDAVSLVNILSFLNNKDRDILFLTFINGKAQTDIMQLLKRSQPSLSYDIKRIRERVGFICKLLSYFNDFMTFLSSEQARQMPSEQVMVLTLMYFTTSFSQAARITGLKPTRIRYVFDKLVNDTPNCQAPIKQLDEPRLTELFTHIRQNLNAVRRSYRPPHKKKK